MHRRLFASLLTLSVVTVFLLFGSFRLQWQQTSQSPLSLNVSLGFKLPATEMNAPKRSFTEALHHEFLKAFGEAPPSSSLSASMNLPGHSLLSHQSASPPRVITVKSVLRRLGQMIQIELPQSKSGMPLTADNEPGKRTFNNSLI